MTKPLSVQLYSVRDAIANDLPSAIDRVAAIGFTNVEPYGFAERPAEYAAALKSAGLAAPSGHAPVIDSDDAAQIFDAAASLDIHTVIDPFIPRERWQTLDQIAATAERVNALSEQAATFGLRFGYHNHNWELDTHIDGRRALEYFVDALADDVVLEIDTFWATVGGADVPALLVGFGDRVKFIHVKDGAISDDTSTQQPAGSGDVDVAAILEAAPQALRVVEFDAFAGDVFDGIARSYAWLQENDK
jgi:sugar phosphate isomerase/epimerase